MDKIINFLNRQLPAFWGLLLIAPLVRDHLPDLYSFILSDKHNALLVIGCWILVFEMAMYHVFVPIAMIAASIIMTWFGIQHLLLYKIPRLGQWIYKLWKPKSLDSQNADPLKSIAVKLIRTRFQEYGDLPDHIAITIAKQYGEESKFFKKDNDNRSSEMFGVLTITSLITAVMYLWLSPDLSVIGITSGTAAIGLFISAVILACCTYIKNWDEGQLALHAALLELTEPTGKE